MTVGIWFDATRLLDSAETVSAALGIDPNLVKQRTAAFIAEKMRRGGAPVPEIGGTDKSSAISRRGRVAGLYRRAGLHHCHLSLVPDSADPILAYRVSGGGQQIWLVCITTHAAMFDRCDEFVQQYRTALETPIETLVARGSALPGRRRDRTPSTAHPHPATSFPMPFGLSILDQSTIASGRGADAAIRETLDLARLADQWGYGRYWLAEHHNSDSHAGSAPEMLVAAIAATTRRIRIGTAGVMLPHYSALKVAEQFKVAEAIAPGRIDLGLGRAPGSDGRTAFALNPRANHAADEFPNQVMDLLGWLGDGLPEGHPFRAVAANPQVPTRPEVWILGSSDYGAQLAAYLGLPFCFAQFIGEDGSEQAVAMYRERFRPAPTRLAAPHAALAVFALTADTEAEAWRLYKSRELWRLFRDTGRFPPLPSVAEAEAYPFRPEERAHLDRLRARAIVGAPEQVRAKLEALAVRHGAAEIAVLTPCHDPAARQRSYRLLAEACGLVAGPALAAA